MRGSRDGTCAFRGKCCVVVKGRGEGGGGYVRR